VGKGEGGRTAHYEDHSLKSLGDKKSIRKIQRWQDALNLKFVYACSLTLRIYHEQELGLSQCESTPYERASLEIMTYFPASASSRRSSSRRLAIRRVPDPTGSVNTPRRGCELIVAVLSATTAPQDSMPFLYQKPMYIGIYLYISIEH
jgi:hypothetical protein